MRPTSPTPPLVRKRKNKKSNAVDKILEDLLASFDDDEKKKIRKKKSKKKKQPPVIGLDGTMDQFADFLKGKLEVAATHGSFDQNVKITFRDGRSWEFHPEVLQSVAGDKLQSQQTPVAEQSGVLVRPFQGRVTSINNYKSIEFVDMNFWARWPLPDLPDAERSKFVWQAVHSIASESRLVFQTYRKLKDYQRDKLIEALLAAFRLLRMAVAYPETIEIYRGIMIAERGRWRRAWPMQYFLLCKELEIPDEAEDYFGGLMSEGIDCCFTDEEFRDMADAYVGLDHILSFLER